MEETEPASPTGPFCANCGQPLAASAKFCPACGQAVGAPSPLPRAAVPEPTKQTRDYTSPAIVAMVLYFLLWIPGLVANVAYLESARAEKRRTGTDPDGMGCLWSLLALFVVAPIALVIVLLFFGVLGTAVSSVTSSGSASHPRPVGTQERLVVPPDVPFDPTRR